MPNEEKTPDGKVTGETSKLVESVNSGKDLDEKLKAYKNYAGTFGSKQESKVDSKYGNTKL
jgi:hypothetical protein